MSLPLKLSPYRDVILALSKASATSEPYPASQIIDPKASRLGGTPFTPIYTDWPSSMITEGLVSRKQPQSFIGQFNFREIVAAVPELVGTVPSEGLFQLFYDMNEPRWGDYPKDFNFISTLWFPDVEELRHTPLEAPVPSYPEREFGLKFSYRRSYPELDRIPEEVDLPEDLAELYADWASPEVHHQIAGHPLTIQNDVLEVFEDMSEDETPWQMLLQIDSDEAMKIMWCDTGTLYLAVQTYDLASADLSQARLIMQCC